MSRASARTREQVDNITPPLIRRLDYVFASDTGCNMHFWGEFGACRQKVILTNQSRFAHYHCDFGNGPPQWVGGSPMSMPGAIAVLPVDPRSDGYNIVISDEACVMESILANEFWNAHAQLVY
ncbi:hypothetical protein H4R19_001853 [Coemansia spiralis]|nr:hypothetical protein H4R19_001853 [Coemansia spiralis]